MEATPRYTRSECSVSVHSLRASAKEKHATGLKPAFTAGGEEGKSPTAPVQRGNEATEALRVPASTGKS